MFCIFKRRSLSHNSLSFPIFGLLQMSLLFISILNLTDIFLNVFIYLWLITCISLLVNAFMSCSRKALGKLTRMYEIKPKLRRRRDGKGTSSGVNSVQFSLSHVQLFSTPWAVVHQASRPSPTPRVYPDSCPLSWWCHPTISSSVIPFSSLPQSFPESGSFPVSQFFASGGRRIGVSASASVLPVNNQDWSPLGWTGWISLQSKGLSRVFSNTTVQKHQFFGVQLSL